MNILPKDLPEWRDVYKIAAGCILPRPIAWVSTVDIHGTPNLAPFSFFTVASSNPLTLMFTPLQSGAAGNLKDTPRNILATKEFVVNITNEATAAAMSRSAADIPRGESEFPYAQVTPAPSNVVKPPRVAEAPVSFECKLTQTVAVGAGPGSGLVVLGEVVSIHFAPGIYDAEKGYIDLAALQPIGRLSGSQYVHVTDLFEIARG